jgi:DNA-binding Lrp family transcriptional regulator
MSKRQKFTTADLRIIDEIQRNRRASALDLEGKTEIPKSTISRKIKQYQDYGVFRGNTSTINPKTIGIEIVSFVTVSLLLKSRRRYEEFHKKISQISEIMECYAVTGNYDFVLKILAKDWESYSEFIETKLVNINNISFNSLVVVREIKYEISIPLEAIFPEVAKENGRIREDKFK